MSQGALKGLKRMPKMSETRLYFSRWGWLLEITNQHLNSLVKDNSDFEIEGMRTANSCEHRKPVPVRTEPFKDIHIRQFAKVQSKANAYAQ
jgi:mannosyl-3-phosphoglycerate synthase